MEATKKTSLHAQHLQLNAKMTNFGGWEMPLFYDSVLVEHHTVRNHAGLFDISHMGEIRVKGKHAENFLNHILVNDIKLLDKNQGQYTALCNEQGGVIDDLIIYKLTAHEYFLCVNASNSSKDFAWIIRNSENYKDLTLTNESDLWSQLAIQGPKSREALTTIFPKEARKIKKLEYMHVLTLKYNDESIMVARSGYTGELGFEIYLPHSIAPALWNELLEKNITLDLKPIGLGARDTLRLEASYLLHGNDMDNSVSPLEAGIAWTVKFNHDFIGKSTLERQKNEGLKRKVQAFKMIDSGIPRHGMYILQNKKKVGMVTSGSVLPTVGGSGGFALLLLDLYDPKQDIQIDIRGQEKQAKIVPKPLYKARIH